MKPFNMKSSPIPACIFKLSGLIYLFNGISTPYELFNAKIWLICKHLIPVTIDILKYLYGFKCFSYQKQIIFK